MSATLPKLFIAVGGLLVVAGPAQARPNFRTTVAPALVQAINRTQGLKKYNHPHYSTDYRATASNFQRPRKMRRAPRYDKAGMKAYIFGVRAVTPHIKTFSSGSEVMATAVRRVVGVVLLDRRGKPTLDAQHLRITRTDKISLRPLFGP
jgi:hypothetical protein